MRAGACTVQQALTSEAASALKLSLTLARRRGHPQVTPLHVAATLLSSRASLLRRACIKSNPHPSSHPLHCRALELCFNVALNRLPTNPSLLLHSQPSLSNALIAALKRAQAHQRRGCIEQQQQQQPLLAIKVEMEQLILSILDDPSVSRVMREAGFSSTCVKSNLEDTASSAFRCYSSCPSSPGEIQRSFWPTHFLSSSSKQNQVVFPTQKEEDLRLVLEVMVRKKRRNMVLIGDKLSSTEGLVMELMRKVETGEVPQELRSVQFVKLQLCSVSLKFMKREDVEMKVLNLRRRIESLALEGGAVIYAGDLRWAMEEESAVTGEKGLPGYYSPVDHVIVEVGRLLSDFSSCSSSSKVWLIAVSDYQTYMKCQMKTPTLELRWTLQPLAVPSGGLALSLQASCGLDARITLSQNPSQLVESKPFCGKEEQEKLICCAECISNFEKEAGIFNSSHPNDPKDVGKGSSDLPNWLQQHRHENHHQKDFLVELRRKWSRLCQSLHHSRYDLSQLNPSLFNQSCGKSYNNPWFPSSLEYKQKIFTDLNSISFSLASRPGANSNFVVQSKKQELSCMDSCARSGASKHHPSDLNLNSLESENMEVKISLSLGNPLFSDSTTPMNQMRRHNDSNDLCRALQENIHWQSESIPAIAEALNDGELWEKKGTWLLMQGTDLIGKRRLARAIAESVYGSADRLVEMNLKIIRDNNTKSCAEILSDALRTDSNRVVLIKEIDVVEPQFIQFLANGYENGKFDYLNGGEVSFAHSVIIMTTGSAMKLNEDHGEKPNSVIRLRLQIEETVTDTIKSNDNKRKAEWYSPNNGKRLRTGEEEDPLIMEECETKKKEFSRQSSAKNLDLNVCAEDDGGNNEESNAVNSDLTEESVKDIGLAKGFLQSVKNQFVFNRNHAQVGLISEKFRLKLEGSFKEVSGIEKRDLRIDDEVLEELVKASATFVDSLFEKWVKDVFQTSLVTFEKGGKVMTVRLSLEGKDRNSEFGFSGSALPKTIQVD